MERLRARILVGDCLALMGEMDSGSADCCVTSPPYWGLRDYGVAEQLGLERTPEEYVEKMVEVFRGVRRVLRDDGTLWLNLGDSYARCGSAPPRRDHSGGVGLGTYGKQGYSAACKGPRREAPAGLKEKDLVGIPWRVAFALQADGWYLRSDIVWSKPRPMPESIRDRPTKAHEYVFLMAKSRRYYYDREAIREDPKPWNDGRFAAPSAHESNVDSDTGYVQRTGQYDEIKGANRRSVWDIRTQPFPEAHFAVMPEALAEPCILAGSRTGGTVLDPFAGAGTVALVAAKHGRHSIGCEINPEYARLAQRRLNEAVPLLVEPSLEGEREEKKP